MEHGSKRMACEDCIHYDICLGAFLANILWRRKENKYARLSKKEWYCGNVSM